MRDYERDIREVFMTYPQFEDMDMKMKNKIVLKALGELDLTDAYRAAIDRAINFYATE